MIGNHKFSSIEKLKMTRAEEYDYNEFLSDSSDDYPKYEDLVEDSIKSRHAESAKIIELDEENVYPLLQDRHFYWFYRNKFNSIENNINYSGTNIALAKSENNS